MFVISGLDPHLDTSPDTQQEMEVIKVEVVDASDQEPLRVKEETAGVHDVTNTYLLSVYTHDRCSPSRHLLHPKQKQQHYEIYNYYFKAEMLVSLP